jgi:N-acetylglucosaminyldiphosphoundecaprenol N-acetyl-beta-D-mannosaminyltransferase
MRASFYNLYTDIHTTPSVMEAIASTMQKEVCSNLFFINAHCFNIAQKKEEYRLALNSAEIILNDGIGLKLASYFTKIRLPENMNGTDLIPVILKYAAEAGKKVFLLGAKEEVVTQARDNLLKKIPGLEIADYRNGYFDFNNDQEVIDQINKSEADILIVGMGVPRQELWLHKSKSKFTNLKLAVAGGAVMDFQAEVVQRAPMWMQKTGLEWVFRLLQEPGRLFKRYIFGNFEFFFHVFRLKLSGKKP